MVEHTCTPIYDVVIPTPVFFSSVLLYWVIYVDAD